MFKQVQTKDRQSKNQSNIIEVKVSSWIISGWKRQGQMKQEVRNVGKFSAVTWSEFKTDNEMITNKNNNKNMLTDSIFSTTITNVAQGTFVKLILL